MSTAPAIGTMFDTYEIQAFLGSGGMAWVYRGFDHNLRRQVAIKVLSDAVASQPGFAARFQQEARLIASLQHPHIVHVYDFGEQDGYTYMVQELLPGPTLEQRLSELKARNEQFGRQDILSIVTQLARALDAAHAAGIIHRDVKPSNVMWNASGNLVLTDFGIARQMFSNANQTQTGTIIGTPNYLSPEQAKGLPLTPASDIYALGVVMHELITGKVPFAGDTPMQVVLGHIQTPPPPLRQVRPDIPPAVEAVVQRALHKDPAARFRGANALAQALEQAWRPDRVPAAAANAPTMHDRTTHIWSEGAPTIGSPAPARPQSQGIQIPPVGAQAVPASRRVRMLLPVLGSFLALFFLCGALLVVAGGRDSGTVADMAPTPAIAESTDGVPAAIMTSVPPTATLAPPTEELPSPTVVSEPPTAEPAPVVPADPFDQMRVLFETSITAGRLDRGEGNRLIKDLDEIERFLERGDMRKAGEQLDKLDKDLRERIEQGKIAADVGEQALTGIDVIAVQYGLSLAESIPGDGDDDGEDDDDDDDDDRVERRGR